MVKTAICDDNEVFLMKFKDIVSTMFSKYHIVSDISAYSSGSLLLQHHTQKPFDIIFLDIDMPRVSGFDVAAALKKKSKYTLFVFVTNHNELIYDSFLFQPLNFITKSSNEIMQQRLITVVRQIKERLIQHKTIILENDIIGKKAVNISDIVYIESNRHNVIYHIKGEKDPITISGSISALQKEYNDCGFIRIHKKYLVNMKHMFNVNISKEYVEFKDHSILSMSRNLRHTVDEAFTQYLRRTS